MRLYQFHSLSVLNKYSFFSIGKSENYFNLKRSKHLFDTNYKVDRGLLESILKDSKKENGQTALALSGSFIEHLLIKNPSLIQSIKDALHKNKLVLFASTFHDSIASIFSIKLFNAQIQLHKNLLKKVFDYEATVFYNTGSIYFDELANLYKKIGFKCAIAPSSSWHLNNRPAQEAFISKNVHIKLLLTGENGFIQESSINNHVSTTIEEPSLELVLNSKTAEKYLVPQPLLNHQALNANNLWDNPLQKSLISKITYLEQRITKNKKTDLMAPLSTFTSLDYFQLLNESDDENSMRPYDQYINIMNILSDFEIINKL